MFIIPNKFKIVCFLMDFATPSQFFPPVKKINKRPKSQKSNLFLIHMLQHNK